MNAEPENFEQVERLLILKRHEKPPPGYFHGFSAQVIARIQAGERGESASFFDRFFGEALWLQRFWEALEGKPALAGAFGVAVCVFLVSGIVYSGRLDASPGYTEAPLVAQSSLVGDSPTPRHAFPAQANTFSEASSSTAPVLNLQYRPSLFGEVNPIQPTPVSYQLNPK